MPRGSNELHQIAYLIYKKRHDARIEYQIALALAFAGLTGLGAQLRIPLPFTPVPITGQVFFVLLSGVMLGRLAIASQSTYLVLGVIGVPWFADLRGGYEVIIGGTGGYIVGFVVASFVVGWFTDRFIATRRLNYQLFLSFLGVGIIYGLGATWLAIVLSLDLQTALAFGVLPFIPGDILKAVGVGAIGAVLIPKISYGRETDVHHDKGWLETLGFVGSLGLTGLFLSLFWIDLLSASEVAPDITFKAFSYGIAVLAGGLMTVAFLLKSRRISTLRKLR